MAIDSYDSPEGLLQAQFISKALTWAGAGTSVLLVVGLTIWGYKLAVRDVSGIPVVRALEGPMRIAPEDPGGTETAHKGLAVNRIAAEGEAAPPADRLVLAPRPVSLQPDDLPRAELSPVPEEATRAATVIEETPRPPEKPIEAPVQVSAAIALVDELAGKPDLPEQLETAVAEPEVEAEAEDAIEDLVQVALIPDDVPGVTRSLRPVPRPDTDLAALAALTAVATKAAADAGSVPADVETASVAPGTNLVQLGAFDSPEIARAEWQRLTAKFDGLMDGKQRLVQSAVSGGRTFYRLRAVGFASISDARQFCAALTAENAGCIPVVAR